MEDSLIFRVIRIAAALLILAACGTTPEAELRYSAAGGTFINLETAYILADGTLVPFKIDWNTGSAKDMVKITLWHPKTGNKLFQYEARQVTQPEEVMALLAEVKGEIAAAQLGLGAEALDVLSQGIVGRITGGLIP
ncbi:hypothetical protein LCGC14_0895980 [marine sediment metagenome]|uniref:Uncharacterized protein n=1 Tax=marine sediment metagenome TaxID=412755 RepID=A0A0F9P2R2_9ZZZZ